jgi:hypothetical protein
MKNRRGSPRRFGRKHHEEANVLGRPGSDLLFQVLRLSTIGAGKFNGRVRDGIGYRLPANTTRPAKDVTGIRDRYQSSDSAQAGQIRMVSSVSDYWFVTSIPGCALKMSAIKLKRAISTGKLNALPRLHTRPINVVVYHGS